MRQFVIVGHDAHIDAEFSLEDLPGAGRMDLLARCVTASLLLSHGIRDDVRTWLVLADEFTVRFEGAALRGLHPDERSTAALVRNALAERDEAIGHVPVEASPGVSLFRFGFETTLEQAAADGSVCQLHEDGKPASEVDPPDDPVFVLSNHQTLREEDVAVLDSYRQQRITLGPERLHADHAISVAHNWLDTRGFAQY